MDADGTAPALVSGLANIVIHVSDPERSLRLYRDALGFAVAFDSGWHSTPEMLALSGTAPTARMRVVALKTAGKPGLSLASFGEPADPPATFEAAGQVHVGITVRDLDAAVRRSLDAGATLIAPPGEVGPPDRRVVIAFLRDPDGAVIELVQPVAEGGN